MADASMSFRVGGLRCTRALLVLLWLVVLSSMAFAEDMCATDSVHLRGDWGTARFTIELADEPEERAQGLMHRESMPRSAGMLFAYPEPRAIHFWMRNTLIPLDMIFLDRAGVVQKVHSNAQPLDETPIFGGNNIKYVLEVNGGLSERLGIAPGTQLRHPVIESDVAAWPCDG